MKTYRVVPDGGSWRIMVLEYGHQNYLPASEYGRFRLWRSKEAAQKVADKLTVAEAKAGRNP